MAPARYHPGVKEDFDRLYRATYQRVFATLMVILKNPAAAEDAAQEAYMRAFGSWKRWKQDALYLCSDTLISLMRGSVTHQPK